MNPTLYPYLNLSIDKIMKFQKVDNNHDFLGENKKSNIERFLEVNCRDIEKMYTDNEKRILYVKTTKKINKILESLDINLSLNPVDNISDNLLYCLTPNQYNLVYYETGKKLTADKKSFLSPLKLAIDGCDSTTDRRF